jgi:hypothetical protein
LCGGGKDLLYHPLNARGLRVFRLLLARRITNHARREAWASRNVSDSTRALRAQFLTDGVVTKRLDHWHEGEGCRCFEAVDGPARNASSVIMLSRAERELLAFAHDVVHSASQSPPRLERMWVPGYGRKRHIFAQEDQCVPPRCPLRCPWLCHHLRAQPG